jgi:hypothetical protein
MRAIAFEEKGRLGARKERVRFRSATATQQDRIDSPEVRFLCVRGQCSCCTKSVHCARLAFMTPTLAPIVGSSGGILIESTSAHAEENDRMLVASLETISSPTCTATKETRR